MKIASRGIKESEDWVEPMASKQPLSTFLFIGHSDEEIEDIPIREDRTYNIRPRPLT